MRQSYTEGLETINIYKIGILTILLYRDEQKDMKIYYKCIKIHYNNSCKSI